MMNVPFYLTWYLGRGETPTCTLRTLRVFAPRAKWHNAVCPPFLHA